jgi:hypothetical protein
MVPLQELCVTLNLDYDFLFLFFFSWEERSTTLTLFSLVWNLGLCPSFVLGFLF